MAETQETIIAAMRDLALNRDWHNHTNQSNRERVLDFADRLEAALKREKAAVGDCAKLRDALERARNTLLGVRDTTDDDYILDGVINCLEEYVNPALAAPPRQCDVGTAEEQEVRFDAFCKSHGHGFDRYRTYACENCKFISMYSCELAWAQMPYKKEGENDGL